MSIAESRRGDRLKWFTSSYSNGAGGECVECAWTSGGVLVRDSKGSGESAISVRGDAWRSFVQNLKHGQSAP
ncbi:DUF397 domain-containing protein [Streptomyces bluensis]|uniref:DUF397 domain-containing protein n=1 Tax=Streptomyces bluensis TaxID=33897 RepID=UPI0016742592|nr:DUF397 domain-containing protein [Streptomyces bluensis]GGZ74721.1 hypothetical protein GCM10010344_47200 [Streptomyces bluensis]